MKPIKKGEKSKIVLFRLAVSEYKKLGKNPNKTARSLVRDKLNAEILNTG